MNPKNRNLIGPWIETSAWTLAIGLGLLGLWHFHGTELSSGFDQVPGGRGDNRFITSILEYLYQTHRGLGQYFSPFFYFPAKDTLGYSDAFLTHAFLYGWLRNLGWDIFSSYQFCVFAFDLLNYLFCFLMLRSGFKFGTVPSALGAFLFAFNAPKFNQIAHAQLQCLFWMPLALWLVVIFIRNHQKLDQGKAFCLLACAALAVDVEFSTSFYSAWFMVFWVCLFMVLNLAHPTTRDYGVGLARRFWKPLMGAFTVGILGLIPFFELYLPVLKDLGGKSFDEVKTMIPDPICFLWMGPDHGWWGWLQNTPAIQNLPIEGEERIGFGWVALAEWLILTIWAVRRLGSNFRLGPWAKIKKNQRAPKNLKNRAGAPCLDFTALAVLATLLFCLLGCRYGNGFTPWYWVYRWVPGAQSIRAVARYAITLALPLSILTAWVFQRAFEKTFSASKGSGKPLLTAAVLLAAGLAAEQVLMPPCPGFSKKAELARLEYLSQKLPGQCMVFYVAPAPNLPVEPDYSSTNLQIDAMLISAARGLPTLNGYSGHSPHDWGLFKLRSPDYGQYVKDWMASNHLSWRADLLEIDR